MVYVRVMLRRKFPFFSFRICRVWKEIFINGPNEVDFAMTVDDKSHPWHRGQMLITCLLFCQLLDSKRKKKKWHPYVFFFFFLFCYNIFLLLFFLLLLLLNVLLFVLNVWLSPRFFPWRLQWPHFSVFELWCSFFTLESLYNF